MPVISLTCPVCKFSKETNVGVLPPDGTTVTCPVCKSPFPLRFEEAAETSGAGSPPPVAPEEGSAPPPSHPVAQPVRTLTFEFTGNAKEYFGIWIVNTLLRIVTLGLYSPWAKVRKRRYFYGNTLLDGAPFDYLADPLAILKGWFIAGLFFGLYSISSQVSPLLGSLFMLVIFGVFPWVVVRSRIFNLRNTTHRNIRFGFNPDYREAYRVFLWWQMLLPFTLGILAPYIFYRQRRFLVENSRYGSTPFRFHAKPGDYYKIFLPLIILFPIGAAVIGGIGFGLQGTAKNVGVALSAALFFLGYLVAALYVQIALTNLTWNSTSLGGHRFACSLRVRDLFLIYFTNAAAILCSLGLLGPWAAVRLVRYRLDRLTASGIGGFDAIRAAANEQIGAASEELGDMLGFDLGL